MEGLVLEPRATFRIAAVAQRIRASVFGTECRGFESLQPHFEVYTEVGAFVYLSELEHDNYVMRD